MNEFKDRQSQYPNRQKFTVKNVKYNNTGELAELTVDAERQEGLVYEEGTELTSTNLNTIITSMIKENIINYMSADQAIYLVRKNLILNNEYDKDFELPSMGDYNTKLTWEVKSGTGIIIEDGNKAIVTRQAIDQNVVLRVKIEKEGEYKTKELTVTIPKVVCQEVNRTVTIVPDGSSTAVKDFYEEISEDVNVVIENDYTSLFNVTYSVNLVNMNICFTITAYGIPATGGTTEYNYVIKLNSKRSGLTIKIINCNVIFISSVTPDD